MTVYKDFKEVPGKRQHAFSGTHIGECGPFSILVTSSLEGMDRAELVTMKGLSFAYAILPPIPKDLSTEEYQSICWETIVKSIPWIHIKALLENIKRDSLYEGKRKLQKDLQELLGLNS